MLLWVIFFADLFLPIEFRAFGIRPRVSAGMIGIVFWPLIHGNLQHLVANSFAFFTLLFFSLSYSKIHTLVAVLATTILGGAGVWLFGTTGTVHIGASGVIFGLLGFLLFIGIFRREWKALGLSIIVFLFYGGMLFTLLINTPGISWSGHFFGFVAGVFAAYLVRKGPKSA